MKKLLSLLISMLMLTSAACGKKAEKEPLSEVMQAISYREAEIALGEEFDVITSIDRAGDNVLIFGIMGNTYTAFLTDTTFSDRVSFQFIPKDNEAVKSAAVDRFGKTCIVTYLDGETMMYIFNKEGACVRETALGELIPDAETGIVLICGESGSVLNVDNETVYFIGSDLENVSQLSTDNALIKGIAANSAGEPMLVTGDSISRITSDGLADTVRPAAMPELIYTMSAGNEKYSLIAAAGNGIFGLDGESWIKLSELSENRMSCSDIIVDFIPGLNPNTYYLDLTPFIENDPDINRGSFIPGFLEGISLQGKIPMIFPNFSVGTAVAKTKLAGERESMTYEEYCEFVENRPEGMKVYEGENLGTMRVNFASTVDYDDFIDYDRGICHFDDPVFIRLLKLVKENHIGVTTAEFEEDRRINGSFLDYDPFAFSNDRSLIMEDGSDSVSEFFKLTKARSNEPVTFIGFPGIIGRAAIMYSPHLRFSIMATSKHPEAAWDFIKIFLKERSL